MAVANGMLGNGNKLMQEIYDQFLVCKICYEPYRQPKTLVCLHTFCCGCIEKHQDAELERSYRYLMFSRTVKCPICRKNTDLPPGGVKRLPDNFLVANLTEVISRRKHNGKSPTCEICQPGSAVVSSHHGGSITHGGRTAVSKCLDCSKLLCANCLDLHKKTKVTRYHSYIDADVEKDIECKVHTNEVVRFYCEPCEICICVLCTFQEHKGHEVSSFTDGLQKYSNTLDNLVGMCRDKINTVRDQIELINRCEGQLKEAEERIRDTATDSILAIRRREKEMVTNLYDSFGEDGINFLKEKHMLQETLDSLQSTTNLTDVILKDKSIELLLLKREIESKLQILLEKQMEEPPEVMTRPLPEFIPEDVRFGHLTDNSKTNRLSNGDVASRHEEQFGRKSESDMEISTQTDTSFESESDLRYPSSPVTLSTQFTMTSQPNVSESHTTTETPSTTKRQSQTLPIPRSTKETATVPVETKSVGFITTPPSTNNMGTLTNKIETLDDVTDTCDLIRLKSTAMETVSPQMRNTGTYTEPALVVNRGCQKEKPDQCDKITFTARTPTRDRDTATEPTYTLNFGQTFRTPGVNKGTGTKTTILSHVGVGDHVAQTCDQSVDTLWRGSITPMATKSTMPDLQYSDQGTETDRPGMVDSCTSPVATKLVTVATNTRPRKRIVNKDKIPMATCGAQTNVTMDDPVTMDTNTSTFQTNHQGNKIILDKDAFELFLKKLRSNMVDGVTMTEEQQTAVVAPNNRTEATSSVESGTNTPTVKRRNKETETVAKETKNSGTYTFVSTIEKATYMAQPVVVSTGTSTPTKTMATKKLNTPVKQFVNSSTNTPPPARALEVPSAFKGGVSRPPPAVSRGTNTPTRSFRDSGSGSGAVVVKDVKSRDVGVLKRPHTLSRGVGTPAVRRGVDRGTGPEDGDTTLAGKTGPSPGQGPHLVDRESSPIRAPILHRATSTLSLHLVDRESSPIRFSQLSKSTSTPQLYTPSSGSQTGSQDDVQTATSGNSPSSHQMSANSESRERLRGGNNPERMRSTSASTNKNTSSVWAEVAVASPSGGEKQKTRSRSTLTSMTLTLSSSTATDTVLTNDAQTDSSDLPRFHDLIDGAPVTVSRGTQSHDYHVVHRETSPIRFPDEIKPRTVDKGVNVTKADLVEPRETFQRAGSGSSRRPLVCNEDETPYRPNLDAIREDSCESSRSTDDEQAKSGKASPIMFYEVSAPAAEEIRSVASSIVTHTEKLWVTQSTPSVNTESTFADGKLSPTSILCRVETGTSTPPIPPTEDKAVSTESFAIDTKMAECISKLRTVRARLEQHPGTTASTTHAPAHVLPAPGPIYTKTQQQSVCTVTESPKRQTEVSTDPKVISKVTGSAERKSTKVKAASKDARLRLMMSRDSSTDSGPDSPTSTVGRSRKARKQRLDLSQMLRSNASTANLNSPPLPAGAIPRNNAKLSKTFSPSRRSPKRSGALSPSRQSPRRGGGSKILQSRQPPLIPKMDMNIKDYRKHSPGVKRKSKLKHGQTPVSMVTVPEIRNKVLDELAEEPKSGSDSNSETPKIEMRFEKHEVTFDRPEVKISLSTKVDPHFLPQEENIRRTEKPLVRRLPPPRFQERESLRMGDREPPTKVHVEWHKRRLLTRQLSLDDLHRRRGSLGGGGGAGGGSGTAAALGVPLPTGVWSEYPQKPMMSFNYHRSTGQLQVKAPEDTCGGRSSPTTAAVNPSTLPRARGPLSRRASIDVAGIGRGQGTAAGPNGSDGSPSSSGEIAPSAVTSTPYRDLTVLSRSAGATPSAPPRRRSLIISPPEFSTLQEHVPLAETPEETVQSEATAQSFYLSGNGSYKPEVDTDRPKPPPRRRTLSRRGSVA